VGLIFIRMLEGRGQIMGPTSLQTQQFLNKKLFQVCFGQFSFTVLVFTTKNDFSLNTVRIRVPDQSSIQMVIFREALVSENWTILIPDIFYGRSRFWLSPTRLDRFIKNKKILVSGAFKQDNFSRTGPVFKWNNYLKNRQTVAIF
jgi:hypothetical protein